MVGKVKKSRKSRSTLPTQWLYGVGLLIPVLGTTWGLFSQFIHQVHDINSFLWARAVYELMAQGVWFPHWLSQLWYGFGLPVLYFYPPIFYWLAGGLQIAGLSTVIAVKAVLVISTAVGGIFAFLWAKEWVSRPAAWLTAGVWLWSPYYLSLVYVRGAFPEFVALNLIPMLMWFTTRLWYEPKAKYWLGVIISFSLILLTHNLTTIVAAIVYLAYLIYLFTKHRNITLLFQSGTAIAVAGLITSFYWLPALVYRGVINTQILTADNFHYSNNFPELSQLLNIGLNPELGWLTLGLVPITILILGWLTQSEILDRQLRRRLLFCLILASGFLILTIPYFSFIWDWIPGLAIFQFPARFLGVVGLLLALVAGLIVDSFIDNKNIQLRVGLGVLVVVGVMAIPFMTPRYTPDYKQLSSDSSNLNIFNYIETRIQKSVGNAWDKSTTFDRGIVSYEYLPRQMTQDEGKDMFFKTLTNFQKPTTTEDQKLLLPPTKLKSSQASTSITTEFDTPLKSKFVITNTQEEIIVINQFEFPTWRFTLNGAPVTPMVKPDESGQWLKVPIGRNVLEIKLVQTAPMRWGQILTLLGLIWVGIWLGWPKSNRWAKFD